jgi:hypothetical protein
MGRMIDLNSRSAISGIFKRFRTMTFELVIILFMIVLRFCLRVFQAPLKFFRDGEVKKIKVGIEAGSRGWDSVYFEELYSSAVDYLGRDNVVRIEIIASKSRIRQLDDYLGKNKISHLVYDPRTNYSKPAKVIIEALLVNLVCYRRGVIVLAGLTDASLTSWRLQSIIATENIGKIFCLMDVSKLGWLVLGIRITGPHIMPISKATLNQMKKSAEDKSLSEEDFFDLKFRGTLYPTRVDFFDTLNQNLEFADSKIRIKIGGKSESKISSNEYWQTLAANKICITTTFQYVFGDYHTNRTEINQMIFRISEALAAGNLLFVEHYPGISKYFTPGVDFVEFYDPTDLAAKLIYFSTNIKEAQRIRESGRMSMSKKIESSIFWAELF